jgi:ParB family chromosome partitioning protein
MNVKRRGLGRGLDALLKPEEPGVRALPLSSLEPNRLQPRADFDETGLEGLAASIRTQGVVQPIVVTPGAKGKFIIVAGERRWRAARKAGLDEVPVVVREVQGDRELLEMALVENLQRTDLNPVEEGEAYSSLQGTFGLSQEEIGQRVGKSRTTITNAMRLLRLPAVVQDMLRDGRLTAGQARPLLSLATEEEQASLARRAVEQRLSARELEELTSSRKKSGKRRAAPRRVDPHTATAAEKLTRRFQTRVEIQRRGRAGWVRLRFDSEEELMRLYDLLIKTGGKK